MSTEKQIENIQTLIDKRATEKCFSEVRKAFQALRGQTEFQLQNNERYTAMWVEGSSEDGKSRQKIYLQPGTLMDILEKEMVARLIPVYKARAAQEFLNQVAEVRFHHRTTSTTGRIVSFEIKKATRQGIKPLVGLYAESGCGKTYSALLLARGFVGPTGRIVMIDSESGRGSLYADVLPGGYEVMDLEEPFSPMRYLDALRAAEESKAGIVIVDSISHEWSGIGGVLDMAGESEAKSGTKGLHNWNKPKQDHNRMLNRLLQSPLPMIVCMRAKYKTRQVKVDGKTQIIKDEVTTPIQEDTFLFELTLHAEILQNHTIIVSKASHPTLRDCLPKDKDRPITIADGEALAKWCASAGGASPGTAAGAPTVKELKSQLWKLLKGVRGDAQTWDVAEGWLLAKNLIVDGQTISQMTVEQLAGIIAGAQTKLEENP